MKRQLLVENVLSQGTEGQSVAKESVFKIYKDVREIGTQIKEDLLSDKTLIGEHKNRKMYSFVMEADADVSGVMDRAYGIFLLTSLLDGYDANFTRAEKQKLRYSIEELLQYVQEHGYDASPYALNENQAIFQDQNISFIESLTWCFSCFLFAHKLQKREKGDFDFSGKKRELDEAVAEALKILVDNVIRADGGLGWKAGYTDYVGWGAVSGSKQTSLYFTNSVCETYGDLEDTILGNAELGIEADTEYINRISDMAGYDIVRRFEEICKIVGQNTYNKFSGLIGNEFFYEDGSVASKGQIEYSTQSPVLLNQLYAVMIPIYTNYHVVLNREDQDAFNLFQIKVKDGVDMVYKEYVELLNKGKEGIVNRDHVSFLGVLKDKRSANILSRERINIAVLEALIVRARAMIVTYVTKYPEKELGEIIAIIENNRPDEGKWIWGNLQETERCVSALKEFFDYYKEYERDYAKMTAESEVLNALHKKELEEQMRFLKEEHSLDNKRLREKHQQEVSELKAQIQELSNMVENGSPIEREIKNSIDECIYEKIDAILIQRLERIALKNEEQDTVLTEQEVLFKQAVDKYVQSYFADALRIAEDRDGLPRGYGKLKDEQILSNLKECMDEFLSYMLPFACMQESKRDFKHIANFLRKAPEVHNTPEQIMYEDVKQ